MIFPTTYWKAFSAYATFVADALPSNSGEDIFAALVFLLHGDKFVLADIRGRGLCIPSGRLKSNEPSEQAAIRETLEETGATCRYLLPLGYFELQIHEDNGISKRRLSAAYLAEAEHFAPLDSATESFGIALVERRDLPQLYYMWDPLLEAVFDFALATRAG